MATYLLVDLSNLAHRCLHASSGTIDIKTGLALHVSFNAFKQSWQRFQADHIVVCLDGKSWRHSHYSGYKAQRRAQQNMMSKKEREDNEVFFGAFDLFVEFLRKRTNVTVLSEAHAEADDLIARWIQLHPDDSHVILSSDRDFFQLLSDKVKMYDGVRGWTISTEGYFDEKDKPVLSKRTVTETNSQGKKVKKTVNVEMEKPDPEYALFTKCIRGDASDNIMSAYPGVREHGSAKKPGIREAYDDRHDRGFNWNNFMLQEWDKLVGVDEDGNPIKERVRVIDEYKKNQALIDLTMQPESIKAAIDEAIMEAVEKKRVNMVGVWFLKFAEEMNLVTLSKYPNDYAKMLTAPYS